MNILILDTEATGFFSKKPFNDPGQSAIIQLAFQLYEYDINSKKNKLRSAFNSLIKPEFFSYIPEESYNVHKISFQNCLDYGIPLKLATESFIRNLNKTDVLAGHGIAYDTRAMYITFQACGVKEEFLEKLKNVKKFDTQQKARKIVNIKDKNNRIKIPSLNECVSYLFGHNIENAHDALVDVDYCSKVVFKLFEMGIPI